MLTMQIALREQQVQIGERIFTMRENTAAEGRQFEALVSGPDGFFTPKPDRTAESTEAAFVALTRFLLRAPDYPDADILADCSLAMTLALVEEQSKLNDFQEILGNLVRRGQMNLRPLAADSEVSSTPSSTAADS